MCQNFLLNDFDCCIKSFENMEHFGALKFFAVDRFERFLIETFSQSAGYVKRTAKVLKVVRVTLFRMPLTDLFSSVLAILNPKQPKENKSFNFDYSYWSHTTVSFTASLSERTFTHLHLNKPIIAKKNMIFSI